jgi:hypothetical protein
MRKFLLAGASLFLLNNAALAQNPLQQFLRLLPPQVQQQLPQSQQQGYPYARQDPQSECIGFYRQHIAVQQKWQGYGGHDPRARAQANNEIRGASQAFSNCLQGVQSRIAAEQQRRLAAEQATRQAEMQRQADAQRASQERIAAEARAKAEAEIAAKERE